MRICLCYAWIVAVGMTGLVYYPPTQANAAVSLLGVQYQEDEPFTEYLCFWHDRNYPTSCGIDLPGANVHVFIKNDGPSAVTLDDVTLAGYSLKTILKQNSLNDHIVNSIWFYWDNPPQTILDAGEPAWYKMDPKSIPAGGVGQVIIRLRKVPITPTLAVNIDTSGNTLNTIIAVNAGAPQVANISFSADLKKVYLYWRRADGAAPATIKMDGTDVTSITTTVGDVATDFAVSVISLSNALTEMSYHVFQGIYDDGMTATGGIRVWVNPFVYGSWGAFPIPDGDYAMARDWIDTCQDRGINTLEMTSASGGLMDYLGTNDGKTYADNHNYGFIKDDAVWGTWSKNPRMWFIDDEPDNEEGNLLENFCGTGYKLPCYSNQAGTMGMHFIAQGEELRSIKNRPTTINLDGSWKPYAWYAYGQLSDNLCIDHYYQPKVMNSYYDYPLTKPLYAKATVVYATAAAGTRAAEPNPSRQLLYSCAINRDGYAPWPWAPPETKRIEAYYALAGGAKGIGYWWFKKAPTASNGLGDDNLRAQAPALWKEIGLIGAEIKTLQPYLVTSHPVDLDVQGSANVWVKGLARGTDTLILIVVNDDYWNDQTFHYSPVSNATVTVALPVWMRSPTPAAFELRASGLFDVNTQINANQLIVNLGTLDVTCMIIITTDPQLRANIQQRYADDVWPGICRFAPDRCLPQNNPPAITQHPSNQIVAQGGTATFTVMASGSAPFSYRWQKNNADLYDGGHYSGATTATLTILPVDSNDAAGYRCVVTNSYGSVTSNEATLAIAMCTSPNLVNGNFEGTNTGGIATGWTAYTRSTVPSFINYTIENASPPEGLQYQQIQTSYVASGGAGVYQVVTGCVSGATYRIQGSYRTNSASGRATVKCDPHGGTTYDSAIDLIPAATTTSSTWNTFNGTVTAAGSSITLFLDCQTHAVVTGNGKAAAFDGLTISTPKAPQVTAAVSRKTHGGGGSFDIDVFIANAVECRSGGPTMIVVTFDQSIQRATGTTTDVIVSSGLISSVTVIGNQLIIMMNGISDSADLAMMFPGIVNSSGQPSGSTLCFSVLTGDVTGDKRVNVFDLQSAKGAVNQPVTVSNFRDDVTADGGINVLDLLAVRNNLNHIINGSCP